MVMHGTGTAPSLRQPAMAICQAGMRGSMTQNAIPFPPPLRNRLRIGWSPPDVGERQPPLVAAIVAQIKGEARRVFRPPVHDVTAEN